MAASGGRQSGGVWSGIERLLRIFTEVRPGEGPTALLMLANVFLILCAYYFIKPLREGWISVSGIPGLEKMEVKAYTSFGQSLMLIPVIHFYSRLATKWSRRVLLTRSTLFCMSNMLLFWALQPDLFIASLPFSGIAFYIWVGMFGVFVVAQFFAFVADVYTDEAGRRLMPLVAIGATSGAAFGSMVIGPIVSSGILAREYLLLAAMVPLGVSILLTQMIDSRENRSGEPGKPAAASAGASDHGGIQMVFGSRFLLAVAIITMLVNWVNSNGENLLFRVVQDVLAKRAVEQGIGEDGILAFTNDGTTLFYSNFFAYVNAVALVLQAFVASRILKYGGFAVLLLAMPTIALVSYSAMALVPILAIIKPMKIAENATDYSINNTARNVLWLPTTSEMKFKGKPTIDTLFARLGDGMAAVTVLLGVQALYWATQTYFIFTVGLVVVWLVLCFPVIREHRRLARAVETPPAG